MHFIETATCLAHSSRGRSDAKVLLEHGALPLAGRSSPSAAAAVATRLGSDFCRQVICYASERQRKSDSQRTRNSSCKPHALQDRVEFQAAELQLQPVQLCRDMIDGQRRTAGNETGLTPENTGRKETIGLNTDLKLTNSATSRQTLSKSFWCC